MTCGSASGLRPGSGWQRCWLPVEPSHLLTWVTMTVRHTLLLPKVLPVIPCFEKWLHLAWDCPPAHQLNGHLHVAKSPQSSRLPLPGSPLLRSLKIAENRAVTVPKDAGGRPPAPGLPACGQTAVGSAFSWPWRT